MTEKELSEMLGVGTPEYVYALNEFRRDGERARVSCMYDILRDLEEHHPEYKSVEFRRDGMVVVSLGRRGKTLADTGQAVLFELQRERKERERKEFQKRIGGNDDFGDTPIGGRNFT